MIREALVAAPELAEAHIAMGHYVLHTEGAVKAAGHFRAAIACSPHAAEAHELMGRLLLEAGFLDAAIARLEDAIAIAPQLSSAGWEIARAYALEGRWDDHDRLVADLVVHKYERAFAQARFAWWRGDFATARALRGKLTIQRMMFDPAVYQLFDYFDDASWARHGDAIVAAALSTRTLDLRRRS